MPEKTNFNFINYLDWRGDLSFEQSAFNEIDAAIFAQLTYNHYNGIVSDSFDNKKTIEQVAKEFLSSSDFETRKDNGPLINADTYKLLLKAGLTRRFKNIQMCNFKDELDTETSMQFSAFTAIMEDGNCVVAYRGTHAEIVGWQEDFNMAFETPVPAQTRAVEYLTQTAKNTRHKIIITGHSKGGNLALYAPAFAPKDVRKKVIKIYNLDGQGFDESIISKPEFSEIEPLVTNLVPQASVVGMIFESIGETKIILSSQKDILFQHDIFSWQLLGNSFIKLEERTKESKKIEQLLKNYLSKLTLERRKTVINALFGIFEVSESSTLQDFQANWLKSSPQILKYMNSLDEQTRKDLKEAIRLFFETAKETYR
ncbi:MAG: DUF2974 domain-containing protein [Treponemataceae bacterium]|nr:DUF2974 domain-containing protein [Treponemataceae bacterium]